jgi:hypothetical protein
MPTKSFTEWIQFGATVISPVVLLWLGFASERINDHVKHQDETQQKLIERQDRLQKEAIERQDKLIARQDELVEKEFAASGKRFDQAQKIFGDLLADNVGKKRLAVLAALAFVHEHQLPEFFLPVLAINESKDEEIASYLRQGLKELSLSESVSSSMQTAATRALGLLAPPEEVAKLEKGGNNEPVLRANVRAVTEVAASLATRSSSANASQEEKTRVTNQLQQLAPTLSVVANSGVDDPTRQQAASTLEKAPVADSTRIEQAVASLASNLSEQDQSDLKPRVYLHIANEKQRPKAEEFKQALIKDGKLVPGIQDVSRTGAIIPDKLEVRYFDQAAEAQAKEILELLKKMNIDGQISYEKPSKDANTSRNSKTHFEIWAGKSTP